MTHTAGFLRRSDLRRKPGPGRLECDRFPRADIAERGPCRPLQHAACSSPGRSREGKETMMASSKPERTEVVHHRCGRFGRGCGQGPDRSGRQGGGAGEGPVADEGELRWRRARQHQPLQSLAGPAAQPAHVCARPKPTTAPARTVLSRCRRWWAAARSTGRAGCRASRERLPPAHRRRRPARHDAGRLADHLCRTGALLLKVEWAFGVSGEAGANTFEGSA